MRLFPSMKSREYVAVEILDTAVKLVHLRQLPYRTEVVNMVCVPIAGPGDEDALRALRQAYEKLRARGAAVIAALPAQQVITKNIEIPSEDPAEIREIINLQAGRHTPFSREEIIADYINLGAFKHSYSKVLLIIVSRSVIKRISDLLGRAGIRLSRVIFIPEALACTGQKLLKVESSSAPMVVANVDRNTTEFLVVYRSRVLFSRSIPFGAQDICADKEHSPSRFAEEMKKSLEAYQNEDIEKKPVLLAIAAPVSVQELVKPAVVNMVSLAVKSVVYFRNIALSRQAMRCLDENPTVSFLGAIAGVWAGDDLRVDLTPEDIRMRKALEQRGRDMIKTGIYILIAFVLASSVFLSRIYLRSTYLSRLDSRYKLLMAQVEELEGDFEKITLIRSYLTHRGHLKLTDIRYEDNGQLRVRGTADSMSTVFSFAENLEKSKWFFDVKTRNTMKRKEQGKEVTEFEIGTSMEGKISQ